VILLSKFKAFISYLFDEFIDGIKTTEYVAVTTPHYDDDYTHRVLWMDICKVNELAANPTEENINKLKKDFNLVADDYHINVKLRTVGSGIWRQGDDSEHSTFSLDQVKDFYEQVKQQKINKAEDLIRKKEMEEKKKKLNSTDVLKETINKTMKK
jgi:hypothetical protein